MFLKAGLQGNHQFSVVPGSAKETEILLPTLPRPSGLGPFLRSSGVGMGLGDGVWDGDSIELCPRDSVSSLLTDMIRARHYLKAISRTGRDRAWRHFL